MNNPATEHRGFPDVSRQAASNAVYSHGAELERLQYKTAWPTPREAEGCVLALTRTDEHHAGDYYRITTCESEGQVEITVSYQHMAHVGDTAVTRQGDHWSSSTRVEVTGNPEVDQQLIEAAMIDIIDSWVLPD